MDAVLGSDLSYCTETEIAELTDTARRVGELESSLSWSDHRLRVLAWRAIGAQMALAYLRLILSLRRIIERHSAWAPIAFILLPSALGLMGFFLGFAETQSRSHGAIQGLCIAVITTCIGIWIMAHAIYWPTTAAMTVLRNQRESHLQNIVLEQWLLTALPDELLRARQAHQELMDRVRQRLDERLARIRQEELARANASARVQLVRLNWRDMRSTEFERFLREVFVALEYEATVTKASGDQGVDLIVERNGWRTAVQAKGYQNSVGNSAVQEVYAGMAHYRCQSCAVITNSQFTPSASSLARSTSCLLIDKNKMYDFVTGKFDFADELQRTRADRNPSGRTN